MTDYENLLERHKLALLKSLQYLKQSYSKIQSLPTHIKEGDSETLEVWESYVARFARVSDIFVMKYLKTKISLENPAFRGSVRDLLNEAEKLNLIESAAQWLDIRDLRNRATHDYEESELEGYLENIKRLTPIVLSIEKIL